MSDKRLRADLSVAIRRALEESDDLRKPEYRGHPNPIRGHCYIASEAAYHLLPGDRWKPCVMWKEGGTHWFLRDSLGNVYDLTYDQFDSIVTYEEYQSARGTGFLTKHPSKRARELVSRARKYFEGEAKCLKRLRAQPKSR